MPVTEAMVDGFRRECAEDYVGLWQIARALEEAAAAAGPESILEVVAALLAEEDVAVGQFENGRFVEWDGTREERIGRVRRELDQLGAAPDIGDVAWLVQRPGAAPQETG